MLFSYVSMSWLIRGTTSTSVSNSNIVIRVILESDPNLLETRTSLRDVSNSDVPLGEQTLSQALSNARDTFARALLKS